MARVAVLRVEVDRSLAFTSRSPWLTVMTAPATLAVPSSMMALVLSATPMAPRAPATPATPPPPNPRVLSTVTSEEAAPRSTAFTASIWTPVPISARVVLSTTATFREAPTPAVPPPPRPPEALVKTVASTAWTMTCWSFPPALPEDWLMRAPLPMVASVSLAITSASTVPATPAVPPTAPLTSVVISVSSV